MASDVSAPPVFKKKGAGGSARQVRVRDVDAAQSSGTASTSDTHDSGKRMHAAEENEADKDESSTVAAVLKRRKVGGAGGLQNSLLQNGTFSKRKASLNDDASDEDDYALHAQHDNNNLSGDRLKADRQGTRDDATRTNTWYDDDDNEEKKRRDNAQSSAGNNNDDGLYHGSSAYSKYVAPRDDGLSSKAKAASRGPVRAGNNVRTVTMFDYQPDVCKDYKETGYCGFGDTCKFLHDRSDYLAGWQMDALPNSAARQRGDLGGDFDEDEEEGRRKDVGAKGDATAADEDVPFACLICRRTFTDPVVTQCGHYFCSACAVKRYGKSTKCFACGKQTQGIFNSAKKVLDRMQRAQKLRQEERDARRWGQDIEGQKDGNEAGEVITQFDGQLLEGVEVEAE